MTHAHALRTFIALLVLTLFGSLLIVSTGHVAPARAAEPEPLIFPVVGDNYYSNTFGACRGSGCSRRHHGVDIMTYGVKGVPVVAAADGYVRYVNWSWNAEGIDPNRCCTLAIRHHDGYESWYIHLDNDTPGTDDGQGWGIAPGILPGVEVVAGQLIGWVGDSGNAEGTAPHLHFEYHDPSGAVLDPTPYVDAATRIEQPWSPPQYEVDFSDFTQIVPPQTSVLDIETASGDIAWSAEVRRFMGPMAYSASGVGSATLAWDGSGYAPGPYEATVDFGTHGSERSWVQVGDHEWPFVDDEGTYAASEIAEAFERGITTGCDWNMFCPDQILTRAQLVTMLARSLNPSGSYPGWAGSYGDVPDGTWFTGPFEYLVAEGLLGGGAEFGVDYPASRALIVDMLLSAVVGPSGYGDYQGYFSDVPESAWYWPKVERAYELGIVQGYPDGTFRPNESLTREAAVALLMRGL